MVTAVSDDGMVVELNVDGTWSKSERSVSRTGDYRGVPWGATAEAVQAREGRDAKIETDDVLVFGERLSDMDADAVYVFVGGRLVRAKYMFQEEFTSPNRYLDAFHQVKTLFSRKYGEPSKDETIWHDELFRDDYRDWGKAVERGDLTLIASWATEQTEIGLILHGNDYEAHLAVEYSSISLGPWAASVQSEAEHDLI